MLGVAIGVEPNVAFRGVKTPPALGRGVKVDACLRTSLDGVGRGRLRGDRPGRGPTPRRADLVLGETSGAHVARNLTGAAAALRTAGLLQQREVLRGRVHHRGRPRRRAARRPQPLPPSPDAPGHQQRIVHHGGRVLGFNMLGSRWDHALLALGGDRALARVDARPPRGGAVRRGVRPRDLRAMREEDSPWPSRGGLMPARPPRVAHPRPHPPRGHRVGIRGAPGVLLRALPHRGDETAPRVARRRAPDAAPRHLYELGATAMMHLRFPGSSRGRSARSSAASPRRSTLTSSGATRAATRSPKLAGARRSRSAEGPRAHRGDALRVVRLRQRPRGPSSTTDATSSPSPGASWPAWWSRRCWRRSAAARSPA